MSQDGTGQHGMLLLGMFDSPFVRRVAVSMDVLGLAFEHRNWSVGKDFERIREYSPLGRVPVLVLDDGEALSESALILDYLDERVGPERALLPAHGPQRRQCQRLIGHATGAVEKALHQVMERVFRPQEKWHAPWVERCRTQMQGALGALEQDCAAAAGREWLAGTRMSQADITLACFCTYVREAVPFDLAPYPALLARLERYEALPVLRRFHVPFDAPVTG